MDDSKVTHRLLALTDYELKLIAGAATHQHYKGGLYRLVGPVKDADTGRALLGKGGELMLVYQHLWPHEKGLWVRSELDWNLPVAPPEWHPAHGSSELIWRFRPIGEGWAR